MGIIERFRKVFRALVGTESRSDGVHPRDPAFASIFGVRHAESGVAVNPTTAMLVSVYHACVRVLAETLAMTPCEMKKKLPGGGAEEAFDHSLHELLTEQANPEMTAYTFFETMMVHVLNEGNGLAYKQLNGARQLIELWPLRPDRVLPLRHRGRLLYTLFLPFGEETGWNGQLDGFPFWETYQVITMPAELIFHVRNLGDNGIVGYSMQHRLRNALGLAIAAEAYASKLYLNGARPSGVIEVPEVMDPESYERLKESFNEKYTGLNNFHKAILLEQKATFKPLSFNANDSQMIETRGAQVPEVCRPFRIPPHMVGYLQGSSYATSEQLAVEFATFTMTPWVTRWEQEILRQLLTPRDRAAGYVARFDMDRMKRGDLKSRYEAYNQGRLAGFLSADEIRHKEGMAPLPGRIGKIWLQPSNYTPAGQEVLKAGAEIVSDVGAGPAKEVAKDDQATESSSGPKPSVAAPEEPKSPPAAK